MGFESQHDERYLGFGERSNAVDQRGGEVESYVADGPYQPGEYQLMEAIIPKWGFRPRPDATYYPIPWLLSSAGYGVLAKGPGTSYFHLDRAGTWSVEVTGAPADESAPASSRAPASLDLRFFAGPTPAGALRRFTRETGRQPGPPAPWLFGPWVQPTGSAGQQAELVDRLQEADAPLSAAQTYTHYLPCGSQAGKRDAERQRSRAMHRRGLAVTTYLNPMVCTSYSPVFETAAAGDGLIEDGLGQPYLFRYSTTTAFEVAELDFGTRAGREGFASVAGEAIEDGYDGWMEDFGEYTPLDSVGSGGTPGTALHNPYPRQYHCAARRVGESAPRPIVRFQRSGWTGAAPCAEVVWGGDPTTSWGYDGLRSAVRQALSMGLSGVSIWGSDIGGFFALFENRLSPELLKRWVQFGAVSGVMRTEADGIDIPAKDRPQVWDPGQIANWRRYARLRTQLYPYLLAAQASYERSGMPLMRQLALAHPDDARATGREDEFLFGPDLLAAPVLEPGAGERRLYLPQGRWLDFWRSLAYGRGDGSLRIRGARLIGGRRTLAVPAPPERLPLLVRAGAILPLLPAGVDTLSRYPDGSTTSLAERHRRLVLLAFPRGRSAARFYRHGLIRSREGRLGWILRIAGGRTRRYDLQASMRTLRSPFTPCAVTVDGRRLPGAAWSFARAAGVLSATFSGRNPRLAAQRRC
jgi:sulfoquinovosidase